MTVQTVDPETLEANLLAKAAADAAFREALLVSPRATLEAELGIRFPPGLEVRVVEESPTTVYLVLPMRPSQQALSGRELETVAGGAMPEPIPRRVPSRIERLLRLR